MKNKIDISQYKNELSKNNQVYRFLWTITWTLLARTLPRGFCNKWKIFLLRLFGAKIHKTAKIYSTADIYMPCNLEMKEYSCLSPEVICYNVAKIEIGAHSTISQYSFLCTATHNINSSKHELITKPIIIKDQAWVAADAFIGPGVTIGQGAVVGARAAVFKNVEPWSIVGGNPAKFIKKREVKE